MTGCSYKKYFEHQNTYYDQDINSGVIGLIYSFNLFKWKKYILFKENTIRLK
jgi:hypothetical protein